MAENFLNFSPRVQFRDPGLVFLDIGSTAGLFGGEKPLMFEALEVCHEFFPDATAAVADAPSIAQVFSERDLMHISPPNSDLQQLQQLPLEALRHLEGLLAWRSSNEIEQIIDFFELLGVKTIGEIRRFEVEAFRERWGETGALLWRRLHGYDRQIISPLIPADSLVDYVYLDDPVSLRPFLMHCLQNSLKRLLARLQGRRESIQKVHLHLYCEYSKKCHLVQLRPATPNRDLDLFLKLLEHRLEGIDLENPVREYEMEVLSVPENVQQFDFFEPQERDGDKAQTLLSLFHQAEVTTGFLQPQNAIMPEDGWTLTPQHVEFSEIEDDFAEEDGHFRIKPAHARHVTQAPRPTQLLQEPQPLSAYELNKLHFLTNHPVERLEDGWWQDTRGRDYYWAISSEGQSLWVFYDRIQDRHFLHGYFD